MKDSNFVHVAMKECEVVRKASWRRSWAEVDLSKIKLQLDRVKKHCGKSIMAIVKADAYGHGAVQVAKAIESSVSLLGVANLIEAIKLREGGIQIPILLLGSSLPEEAEDAILHGLELCLAQLDQVERLDRFAEQHGTKAKVHIALDTGMGRLGLRPSELNAEVYRKLKSCRHIEWRGIATHLPSADEDADYTSQQIEVFNECVENFLAEGFRFSWVHSCNSAGSLGYAPHDAHSSLARVGLYLYGVNPLSGTSISGCEVDSDLALTWKTKVTALREIPAGTSISYGRTYFTERQSRVATLACGYADGYPRQLSGKGMCVLLHGQRCPILGRITMDQMMVDVTELGEAVGLGDEAVLLGQQGEECIHPNELAGQAGTIAWHIFTGISSRVERVYIGL